MLYILLYPLREQWHALNVFRYITFRASYAAVTALLIAFVLGPFVIRTLRERLILQKIRDDGPETHKKKSGTPTMGGILILLSVIIPTLLWADLRNHFVVLLLVSTLALGTLGFLDDYLKVVKGLPNGLVGRYKLAGQLAIGLLVAIVLYMYPVGEGLATKTSLPFFKNLYIEFGIFYAIFVMVVPYNMIHYGKPFLEANAAIVAGVILGTLALKTRSIWCGFLIHVSVAISMDLAALIQRREILWTP